MFDAKTLLDDLLGTKIPGTESTVRQTAEQAGELARENPVATGLLAAALLGTGTGRALTGTALKLGGFAAVTGLAYKAYQNYKNGEAPQKAGEAEAGLVPAPQDTSFHPSQAPQGEAEFALSLVRAMIAAARADGHIDDEERGHIADRLKLSGIDEEASAFISAELEKPLDIDDIVASAKTDAQRIELYTASRLAIEPDSRAERGYLDMLAGRLKLPDALVDHVEATVSSAKAEAPAAGEAPAA